MISMCFLAVTKERVCPSAPGILSNLINSSFDFLTYNFLSAGVFMFDTEVIVFASYKIKWET